MAWPLSTSAVSHDIADAVLPRGNGCCLEIMSSVPIPCGEAAPVSVRADCLVALNVAVIAEQTDDTTREMSGNAGLVMVGAVGLTYDLPCEGTLSRRLAPAPPLGLGHGGVLSRKRSARRRRRQAAAGAPGGAGAAAAGAGLGAAGGLCGSLPAGLSWPRPVRPAPAGQQVRASRGAGTVLCRDRSDRSKAQSAPARSAAGSQQREGHSELVAGDWHRARCPACCGAGRVLGFGARRHGFELDRRSGGR